MPLFEDSGRPVVGSPGGQSKLVIGLVVIVIAVVLIALFR